MEEIMSKEELNELMKIKGETRGASIKDVVSFVLEEEGEEGLKKLEDTMAGLGNPIKYREIKFMTFYPLWLEVVILVAIKRLFNYDDKKFQEMGRFAPKVSFILRLLAKYFYSIRKVLKEAPKWWRKVFTIGDVKVKEYDQEKRYMIMRLENFRVHPIYCQLFIGYFSSMIRMIIGSETTCEERKCLYRGDECHEFLIKW